MTFRVGTALIIIGAIFIVAGALNWANDDLLSIGGVGFVVFGAVAICIATESTDGSSR
ncbi:MAG: hypothetical protein JO291_04410 [Acidimicrobiia bacterium]|nr:hypothetical protein [Acidimicrobiia bacterium]